MYALANRFPGLRKTLPRRLLSTLPTPVDEAVTLGAQLGLSELLIKRDDLTAPVYGGNKVRKLEYLLADAQLRDCDTVVTFGSVGSNHALATSIYAHQLDMDCVAVLTDQAWTSNIGSTLRYHALLGTRLIHTTDYRSTQAAYEEIANAHPGGPERVYRIPWGGSSWLGAVGFVNAALELNEQLDPNMPDVIYVACGTMGTAVGLALGLQVAEAATRIEAIQVVPNVVTNPDRFKSMLRETNERLRVLDGEVPTVTDAWQHVTIRPEFLGAGYADPTPGCLDAVGRIADTEGLQLETTYTGKALAALIADARAGKLRDRRVMFWNTYNSRPMPEGLDDVPVDLLPDSLRIYMTDDAGRCV